MSKIKYFVQQSWLLMVGAILFGSLLALTQAAWGPRIERNRQEKFNNQVRMMIPDANHLPVLEASIPVISPKKKTVEVQVKKVFSKSNELLGWAFVAQGAGFADKIQLVVATNADFSKLAGFSVLSSNETPGFGDKIAIPEGYFQKQFIGIPTTNLELVKSGDADVIDENIIAISGATVSSQAVVDALNVYVVQVKEQLQKQRLIQ